MSRPVDPIIAKWRERLDKSYTGWLQVSRLDMVEVLDEITRLRKLVPGGDTQALVNEGFTGPIG